MLKNLLFIVSFVVTSFLFPSFGAAAQAYHVTDDVKIYMHKGPNRTYKIKTRLTAGTPLTLLERNKESGYVHVKTEKGVDGWIDGRYLAAGESFRAQLPQLEETKTALAEEREKVATLASALESFKAQRASEVAGLNEARAESTAKVAQLQNEIVRLENQIEGMDETNLMGWFIRGGLVALAGIIIGFVIPRLPKRRRRNDEWF